MKLVGSSKRGLSSHEVGGKAASLMRLLDCGFPVPPLTVLVQESLHDVEIPPQFREFCAGLEDGVRLAVRSSASVEDSAEASFAGLFETRLGVAADGVADAVRTVIASLTGERVIEYCRLHGIDPASVRMSVVVQQLVPADVAGVCFTRSPMDQRVLTIEAVYGLGEPLVQGLVTPDRWTVDRDSLKIESGVAAYQKAALVYDATDGLREEIITSTLRRAFKIQEVDVRAIASKSLEVEAAMLPGGADVEWAIAKGELWLLQARPLTAMPTLAVSE